MFCRVVTYAAGLAALLLAGVFQASAWAGQTPSVQSVTPNSGPTTGGTNVTIGGNSFETGATVTFGGTAATNVTVVNATQITATTPAHAAGAVDVIVTNPGGGGKPGTLSGGFTYQVPPPTLSGVAPNAGLSTGGTSVTITGASLVSGATVRFGGTAATNVNVTSATEITCNTPPHAAGIVDVVVTNPDSQSGTLAGGFTYNLAPAPTITSVDPISGISTGGTNVAITGTNYVAPVTVTFGGTAATNVQVVSPTRITCTTAGHPAGVVDVVVTNPDGQQAPLADGYTYIPAPAPTVTGVLPANGPASGGSSVIITGTNFAGPASATFGNTAATNVMVTSPTQITATTPAHAAGTVDVVVTISDSQTATLAGGFRYDPAPTVTSISPATGPSTGGSPVTITGTNFVTSATVTIGGAAAASVTVTSATQITATAPQHQAGAVDVVVTNPDGQAGTLAGGFTYYTAGIGGGVYGDLIFVTTSLPTGDEDKSYNATVQVQGGSVATSGLTYIRFGAADLPPGLSLDGLTGAISGTPDSSGTFNVTFTATDLTDNDKAVVVLPLVVYEKNSSFKFDTTALSDAMVNTPYSLTVAVSGEPKGGGLKFAAAGLPPGLGIDSEKGVISGTPTQAGTFFVWLTATKGDDSITTNLVMWVTPQGSSFAWRASFPPAGFLNQPYSPAAPLISLTTQNPGPGAAVYSASGLPPGISYSASGDFSGTPTATGIFPVTFTATDSATGAQLVFNYELVVFSPSGGDTNSLPVNLWAKKASFKRGYPGKDSWQAQWIYNADRRTGTNPSAIYDASTEPLVMSLGSIPEVNVARASLIGARPKFAYKSPRGVVPAIAVKLDESAQTLALTDKGLTIADRYKSTLRNTVRLGTKGYRLSLYFNDKGKFTPALGYRSTAFVVASAKASVKAATKDSLSFAMFMGDPQFVYPVGQQPNEVKTVKVKVTNSSGAVIVDKDFTAIMSYSVTTDAATGKKVYKLKSGKDGTAPPGKFTYDSKSGKMVAALKGMTLAGTALLANSEEHVSVEVTIADKQYFTAVTLFAPKAGSYSTKMPR